MSTLIRGYYGFDDLALGDRIETGQVQVSAALIEGFARLTNNQFEIFMSAAAARVHGFRGQVAHGLLVLSLVDGLKNQALAQVRAKASLGWDWQFQAPVLAGDTIRAVLTVRTKTPVSRQDRGIVAIDIDVFNQAGEVVQTGCNELMVYR